MGMCFAADCKHYSGKHNCKFYRFPKDPAKRRKWIAFLRREKQPTSSSYVCSCHFKDGLKANNPTLFSRNAAKRFCFSSPEKRNRKRKKPEEIEDICHLTSIEEIQRSIIVGNPNISKGLEIPTAVNLSTGINGVEVNVEKRQEFVTEPKDPQPSTSTGYIEIDEALHRVQEKQESDVTKNVNTLLTPSYSICTSVENYFLLQDINSLQSKFKKLSVSFSFEHIQNNNKRVTMYTGLPSQEVFVMLYNLMKNLKLNYYLTWRVETIPKIDQLLMTLMKLRLNVPHEDLACRFGVTAATVTNVVITWIYALHEVLFKKCMRNIPSRYKNKTCLPSVFSSFTNCRIIIDCTEIFSVTPKSMAKQKLTYSSYKSRNTWKGLVGVAPNGVITYASELYPGSTSDKKIVEHCGILDKFESGDLILADKGFLIHDILPQGVNLNIPPFLRTAQFSEEQVLQTESIARARVHVERAIRRMKCYSILELLPASLLPHASNVFQVIAALTNLQYPLIKEVEEYYCLTGD